MDNSTVSEVPSDTTVSPVSNENDKMVAGLSPVKWQT